MMKKVTFERKKQLSYQTNEAYKSLRTNIQFCGSDIKIISFTSCIPNEGKSSVTCNLAFSFTENGKKVLLIDADLRKSVLIGRYQVQGDAEEGLVHYLSGQKTLDEVILETDVPNLNVIFSGPFVPNPAELLEKENFHTLIEYAREHYDYVLIDTPPLGSVIDSAIVAREVDGAVIVIEADAVSYHFAQSVKEQLEKSNVRILGTVLNKVHLQGSKYGKSYGKYYGKYGEE